ncbi:hypothetical protein R6Q57_003258 [Mikania cordata]
MNPRPNNPNPEFNPFSYDSESLRNLLVQLQQNPNIQHFQQQNPNVQPQANFQPGFASYSQSGFNKTFPKLVTNQISCHRINLITKSCRRHKTLKNAIKNVRKTNTRPELGRVVVQRHRNNVLPMKKPLSENATWTNPRTKSKVIRKNAKNFGKKSPLLGTIGWASMPNTAHIIN